MRGSRSVRREDEFIRVRLLTDEAVHGARLAVDGCLDWIPASCELLSHTEKERKKTESERMKRMLECKRTAGEGRMPPRLRIWWQKAR